MPIKKVAIITGASSGFGVEFAQQLDLKFDLDEIWLVANPHIFNVISPS